MIDRVRDLCRSAEETLARAMATGESSKDEGQLRARAIELAREAVHLAAKCQGPATYPHLQAQVVLGWILSATGSQAEAKDLFVRVETGLEKLAHPDPEGAIHILGRLVIWYHEVGEPSQVQRLFAQLKSVTKSAYGPDHPRYLMLEAQGERWLTEGYPRPFGLWHF